MVSPSNRLNELTSQWNSVSLEDSAAVKKLASETAGVLTGLKAQNVDKGSPDDLQRLMAAVDSVNEATRGETNLKATELTEKLQALSKTLHGLGIEAITGQKPEEG